MMEKRESNCREMFREMCAVFNRIAERWSVYVGNVKTSECSDALDVLKAEEPVDYKEKTSLKARLDTIAEEAYDMVEKVTNDQHEIDELWKKAESYRSCSDLESNGESNRKQLFDYGMELYNEIKELGDEVSYFAGEVNELAGELGASLISDTEELEEKDLEDDVNALYEDSIASLDYTADNILAEIEKFQDKLVEL